MPRFLRSALLGGAILIVCGGASSRLELRVTRVDPLDIWQLTDVPSQQGVAVEVVHDPSGLLVDKRVYLLLTFGPITESSLLRRVETGLMIDQGVLRSGQLLSVQLPIGDPVPCPAMTATGAKTLVPKTDDGLACYAVEVDRVSLSSERGEKPVAGKK